MDKSHDDTANRDATVAKTVGGFPAVPTTKVLAIARLSTPLTPEQRNSIMPERSTGHRSFVPSRKNRPMVVAPGRQRPGLPDERYFGGRRARTTRAAPLRRSEAH